MSPAEIAAAAAERIEAPPPEAPVSSDVDARDQPARSRMKATARENIDALDHWAQQLGAIVTDLRADPDNPQDRGIVRSSRHEGDWEMLQVGLGPTSARAP